MELFLEWAWARHHSLLSWYIRPLFVLPYCYFAYKRKLWLILLTLAIFPTTIFWFPAPETVSDNVLQYMNFEREFLLHASVLHRVSLLLLVIVFLWVLALAFWKRSWLAGVLVLNIGTMMKVVWSIFFGGEIGYASIVPSVVTLIVCNTVLYFIWRRVSAEQ